MIEFTMSLTQLEYNVLREVIMAEVRGPMDGKYDICAEDDLFDNIDFYHRKEDYFEQCNHAIRFVERNWERINDFAVLEEGSIEEFLSQVTQNFYRKEYLLETLYDTGLGDHNTLVNILGNEVVRRCLINISTRKACYEKEE